MLTKTLLFCTSFCRTPREWSSRYALWLRAVLGSGLKFDKVAIIDDGSSNLPKWPGIKIVREAEFPSLGENDDGNFSLYHFETHLGRPSLLNFPGWHRSFSFSSSLAHAFNCDKIVHIESDAFVISREFVNYINDLDDGWVAPFSARHGFPEMAIQVVAGSQIRAFHDFCARPYSEWIGNSHEFFVPFTHIVRCINGDRYFGAQPVSGRDDFVTQTPPEPRGLHWWIRQIGDLAPRAAFDGSGLTAHPYLFGLGGNADAIVGRGWGDAEAGHQWAVGRESVLHFDTPEVKGISLDLAPFVHPGKLPFQRLIVLCNGSLAAEVKMTGRSLVCFEAPVYRKGQGLLLRLQHPDATAANLILPEIEDRRELGARYKSVTLYRE